MPGERRRANKDSYERSSNRPSADPTYGEKYVGNQPDKMPAGQVCKGKMQGNFYTLYNIKMDALTAWYASHLAGFKKVQGYEDGRTQIAFYKPDGTIVIFLTADRGAPGENADAYVRLPMNAMTQASQTKRWRV